ncbi:HAMP domain-containing protein, partial [Candidatus Riflebacteria bacterium]
MFLTRISHLLSQLETLGGEQKKLIEALKGINEEFNVDYQNGKLIFHQWYVNHQGKILRWKNKIESRNQMEKLLKSFFPGAPPFKIRMKGKFRFVFGDRFKLKKVSLEPAQLHHLNYRKRGLHHLFWSPVIARRLRPNAPRTAAFNRDEVRGIYLCIVEWVKLSPFLLARMGVANYRRKTGGCNLFYFSLEKGLTNFCFPKESLAEMSLLASHPSAIGFLEKTVKIENNLFTTLPVLYSARELHYKRQALVNLYSFQKQNKKKDQYIVLKSSIQGWHNNIKQYYKQLRLGFYSVALVLLLTFLFFHFSSFVSIKVKLLFFILVFIGCPFIFFFAQKAREITNSLPDEYQRKKKEMQSYLKSLEQNLTFEKKNLLALCRTLRDSYDFRQLTATARKKLEEELRKTKTFNNVLAFDARQEPLFNFDHGSHTEGDGGKTLIKNVFQKLIPLVHRGDSMNQASEGSLTNQLVLMLVGDSIFNILKDLDELHQIKVGRRVLTTYCDAITDEQGEFSYLFLAILQEDEYMHQILASRALMSQNSDTRNRLYLMECQSAQLVPRIMDKKMQEAFSEKGQQKGSGSFENDFFPHNLVTYHYIEKYQKMLFFLFPKRKIIQQLSEKKKKLATLLATSFILLFTLILFFSSRIISRLSRLKEAMRAVEEENYDYELTINSKDELEELAQTFNKMLVGMAEKEQ